MRGAVLDASVVLKWFRLPREEGFEDADSWRGAIKRGVVKPVEPELLFLEVLNAAGRRWGWGIDGLRDIADWWDLFIAEVLVPAPANIARWVAEGLTSYDAVYVALAEERGLPLITADDRIVSTAPDVAEPLAACPD